MSEILKILTPVRQILVKHCKLAKVSLKVKKIGFSNMCETWCGIRMKIDIIDANQDPDLDQHGNSNSDPDRHQNMPIHNTENYPPYYVPGLTNK